MRNRSNYFSGVGQVGATSPDGLHRAGIGDTPDFAPVSWFLILLGAMVALRWLWERAVPE